MEYYNSYFDILEDFVPKYIKLVVFWKLIYPAFILEIGLLIYKICTASNKYHFWENALQWNHSIFSV